jgi:hypothetical protein
LGGSTGTYYLDGLSREDGLTSFATITDFGVRDIIELAANEAYRTVDTETGFEIIAVKQGPKFPIEDLVAKVMFDVPSFSMAARGAVPANLPETFTLSAGQRLGRFISV